MVGRVLIQFGDYLHAQYWLVQAVDLRTMTWTVFDVLERAILQES
jgi:hypothetical protein